MGRKRRRGSAPLLRRRGQPQPATTPRRPHGANLKLSLAAALVVVLVALSAAAWWQWRQGGDAAPAPGALRGANLLLVTIDTLRADRVGAPGLTPTLDALASGGLRFTNAYAHAPVTLPSHASIMTGLAPPAHGVRNNGAYRLADEHVTLAEVVRAAGYRTGAFIGAVVLDSRFGLDQGFDVYDDDLRGTGPTLSFDYVQRRADQEVTRRDPANGLGWQLLGAARRQTDPAGAITTWRRAVELTPDNLPLMLDLAVLLTRSDRPQAARPYLQRYLASASAEENADGLRTAQQLLANLSGG